MDHEEGVGGCDSALPVREAQSVVSQAETMDETPSGVFRPFTSTHGGSNIDRSQHNANDTTGDQQHLSQADAQTCTCFLTIVEISMT
jgi:hypothetical protein